MCLTSFVELLKNIIRGQGIPYTLFEVSLFCLFVYVYAALLGNHPIIAGLSLTIGGGLFTGLIVYALTNHRAKREKDLIKVIEHSQKALKGYDKIKIAFRMYELALRDPEYKVDKDKLKSTVSQGWKEFIDNSNELLSIDSSLMLPELDEFTGSYVWLCVDGSPLLHHLSTMMVLITTTEDLYACATARMKFEVEINEIWDSLDTLHRRAMGDLGVLQRSII